jgi:hypothetical protein
MCWRYREYMPPPTYFSRTTCVLSRVCFTDSAHESRSIPMLLIYFDVSEEGPREAAFDRSAGRRWSVVAWFSGGIVTLLVRDQDIADDEIGVIDVKLVDRRPIPPVAQSPIHGILYPGS